MSPKLSVPKDRLVFAERRVFDAEDPDTGVTFAEAVCLAEAMFGTIGSTGSYTPPRSAAQFKGGGVGPSPTYSYSAAIVEVDVDPSSGWIHVPRVWIAHDIGRALNPTLVRGQVEGSVYMAIGEALMEEQTFRRLPPKLSHALVHKFPSMLEYKSPTTLDMPEVFTELVENPDPRGPFGAKEVGSGAAAAGDAGGRQRGLRRDRRADRRGADHAGEDPEGARREGRGQAAALRPDALSAQSPVRSRCDVPPPWEGGDGKAKARSAEGYEVQKCSSGARDDAACLTSHTTRRARSREAAELLAAPGGAMLVAGGTDLLPNMKRRQQVPPTLIGLRGGSRNCDARTRRR